MSDAKLTSKTLVDILRETASVKPFTPQTFGQARVSMKEAADEIERLQRELEAVQRAHCHANERAEHLEDEIAHREKYWAQFDHVPKGAAVEPPTAQHPDGWIACVLEEAVNRAESDRMAVGHSKDSAERTAAMKDLENWTAKLQEAYREERRRHTQPPKARNLGRDAWPGTPDAEWLRKLARDVFTDHHRQHDTHNRLLQIADRLAQPPEVWQPIETAPKDGTQILTVVAGWQPGIYQWLQFEEGGGRWTPDPECFLAEEHLREWLDGCSYEPTHWMPLPTTPTKEV